METFAYYLLCCTKKLFVKLSAFCPVLLFVIQLSDWMKSFPPAPCNTISFEAVAFTTAMGDADTNRKIPTGHKIVTWQTFWQSWRCFEFVKNSINERNYTIYFQLFNVHLQWNPTHSPISFFRTKHTRPLTFWCLCAEQSDWEWGQGVARILHSELQMQPKCLRFVFCAENSITIGSGCSAAQSNRA